MFKKARIMQLNMDVHRFNYPHFKEGNFENHNKNMIQSLFKKAKIAVEYGCAPSPLRREILRIW